ncbi:WD repeat-containing protein l(2)05287 [Leptinotarsa decemlineata]|uniref:WD repeat-containing protein l(2)05287 n=1 Tax=Leptinotarsa decemlineata TaxID=7539 RepID=UPI003D3058CB
MEVAVNFKGGGSLVKLPPVFSRDGESVFVCSKNAILEYNTRTGKLSFEYKGFIDDIVGFNCHFYESHHCLTACCRNGTVLSWKTMTHFKISEKKLPISQVKTFNIISTVDEDYKAIISYKKNQFIRFASVNIKEKSFRDYKFAIKPKIKYCIGLSSKYFSVAQESDLYFIKLSGGRELSRYSMQATRTFTCLACHQFEEVVLTGDSTGRVLVWQNIFTREKTQSVFHWHTLPVQTVSFSASGSYFYSGGSECVLVKWQLENVNDRKFLPRLPAEVQHVAVANDNLYVAVATNDNAIRILDPTMKQITLIQHLVLGKHYEAGIVYDPRTQALIMNGNQGQIQFYSPDDMSLMFNIDIVDQNKITNERECVMVNTEITKFAISKTGLWLANIEERRDMEYHKEIRLKFWKFDESKQMFQLNTSVEYPHEDTVNAMLFQPVNSDDNLQCITVGNDKKFKVWQLVDCSTVHKKGVAWRCHGVGFYRNLLCSSLSFSVDGSLMATGFGPILTCWVPDSCELKCSLIHPSHKETIKQIQFGNGNQCHLLVSASENQLSVWNILTLSMVWTVPIKISLLIADRLSENMGVICIDKSVFIFSPASNVPVYSSKHLLKKVDEIVACSFIPSEYSNDSRLRWYERSHIYFITSNKELYCVSSVTNYIMIDNVVPDDTSMFSMAIPTNKLSLVQPVTPNKHVFEKDVGHKTIKKYLEGPIHTIAPIRFSCYSLLKSLAVQK